MQDFLQARVARLVCDGGMDLDVMREEGIACLELFGAQKTIGFEHLGEVERAYLEPSSKIGSFKQPASHVRTGLPLLPERVEGPLRPHRSVKIVLSGGSYACRGCDRPVDFVFGRTFPPCPVCHREMRARAVINVHETLCSAMRPQ